MSAELIPASPSSVPPPAFGQPHLVPAALATVEPYAVAPAEAPVAPAPVYSEVAVHPAFDPYAAPQHPAYTQPAAPAQPSYQQAAYAPAAPTTPAGGVMYIPQTQFAAVPGAVLKHELAPAAPLPNAPVLSKKEFERLKFRMQSLRMLTPIGLCILGMLCLGAGTRSDGPGAIFGVAFVVVSALTAWWAIDRHKQLKVELNGSNTVIAATGAVTSASSTMGGFWGRRSAQAVVGLITYRLTTIAMIEYLRNGPGYDSSNRGLPYAVGIAAGAAAYFATKQMLAKRHAE